MEVSFLVWSWYVAVGATGAITSKTEKTDAKLMQNSIVSLHLCVSACHICVQCYTLCSVASAKLLSPHAKNQVAQVD
jgi:hypothetical protein